MREFLEGLDPSTRRGLLVAGSVVLPFASVVGTILLGYVIGGVKRKPDFGRVLATLLVGVVVAAVATGGAVLWWYMHDKSGWFSGKFWWVWPLVWLGTTIASFEIPKRKKRNEPAT
jgi:hypothetical protein